MKTTNSNMDLQLYFRDIRSFELISVEEERELGWRIVNDNDMAAKQKLIASNLRLVVYIARKYANHGAPLADLIEEGNVGLLRAVESFDPAFGVRFSSYASWWIRQAISRALSASNSIIRIPAHVREVMSKCNSASRRIETTKGREATAEELSSATGKSLGSVALARRARRLVQTSQALEFEESQGYVERCERIPDDESRHPDHIVGHADDLQRLRTLLNRLDERSSRVLRMRFGLDGYPRRTLRQAAREVGLTRERVRQIEMDCLRQLRMMFNSDAARMQPERLTETRQRVPA